MNYKKQISFCILVLLGISPIYAQMDNVVEVENNYRPTVKDASKINKLPEVEESKPNHYDVQYSTTAQPTDVYTFQPITPAQNDKMIGNEKKHFASFGYGTEGNILGRVALHSDITKSLSGEIDYTIRGHQGKINRYYIDNKWESRFYSNSVNVNLTQKLKKNSSLIFGMNLGTDVFNYQAGTGLDFVYFNYANPDNGTGYPLSYLRYPASFHNDISAKYDVIYIPSTYIYNLNEYHGNTLLIPINEITDKQHNTKYGFYTELTPYSFGNFSISGDVNFELSNQKYHTNLSKKYKETLFDIKLCPEFKIDENLKFDMQLVFDNANYGMDEVKGYSTFAVIPHVYWKNKNLNVTLGVYANSNSQIAPDMTVNYHMANNLDIYAEAKGGEVCQNFTTFNKMSPYWVFLNNGGNEIEVENEFDQLRLKAGVRFSPMKNLFADINAGYDVQENRAELMNWLTEYLPTCYNPITFVDGRHFYANADIKYQWKDILTVNLFNQYNKWSNKKDYDLIWRPVFNMNWSATAQIIRNFKVGVDFIYQSFESAQYSYKQPNTCDLGASLSYTFPMGLTIYAKGNNLMNKKYDQFLGYKASGTNILLGAAITF